MDFDSYKKLYHLPADINGDLIIKSACYVFDVSKKYLLGKFREQEISDVRAVISIILKKAGWNSRRIGELLNRDSSTIRHYWKRFELPPIYEPKLNQRLDYFLENIDFEKITKNYKIKKYY